MTNRPTDRLAVAAAFCCLLLIPPRLTSAQDFPDTLRTAPVDTLELDIDRLEPSPYVAVSFAPRPPGRVLVGRDLVRAPFFTIFDVLAEAGGTNVFSTGIPGWERSWSWYGIDSRFIATTLNGLPFQNLLTGRPEMHLLPIHVAGDALLAPGRYGGAFSADVPVRNFKQAQPLTEIRFRAGAPGLQGVTVTHGQERRIDAFGRPGLFNVTGSYAGHGVSGEYPNAISSHRQTMLRLRYEQLHWSLEVQGMRSRLSRGAHEGVQPRPGLGYNSIYIRFGALVFNDNAHFRNERSDLSATLRWRWSTAFDYPVTLSPYVSTQNLTYTDPALGFDAERWAVANRYGIRLIQGAGPLLSASPLVFRADVWFDELASANAMGAAPGTGDVFWSAIVADSIRLGAADVFAEAGATGRGGEVHPKIHVSGRLRAAGLQFRTEAAAGVRFPSPFERWGFGERLTGGSGTAPESFRMVRAEAGLQQGEFDAVVDASWHGIDAPMFIAAGERGHAANIRPDNSTGWLGVGLRLGWRQAAARGIWAELRGHALQQVASSESGLAVRERESLPALTGDARLGARFVLFAGDLDLDVYARARGFTSTRSRVFHPPTGMYGLPPMDGLVIPASGILDLHAEAGIREATVFLSFENALAGLAYPGVILVPDYPLPATAFRFGIFWPIWN